MGTVWAGFNKLSKVGVLGKDAVATSGLCNCIAVVGFSQANRTIAIAHYDTLHADLDKNSKDAAVAKLRAFKKWFDGKTQPREYRIGLGSVWYDTAEKGGAIDNWRFNLIVAAKEVFNYEPVVWGHTIRCGWANDSVVMASEHMEPADKTWANAGEAIPYDALSD